MGWNTSYILKRTEPMHNNTKTKTLSNTAMGPEHPCMFLLDMQRMPDPDHSISRPFIRAMLAVSNLRGMSCSPSRTKVTPCDTIPLHVQHPLGSLRVAPWDLGQGHWSLVACHAMSSKVLCLCPSSCSINLRSMRLWQANLVSFHKVRS